ncbi:Protein-glutamate methylesterase/protein-glutamine glutaminase [subsurface metagenome]
MKKEIRILLIDDHQVVREGLQHMLGQEEDMEIVGQCANGEEALSQVEMLSPNIVLMDIKMPGIDGIELTRRLKERKLPGNIIMLTLYDEYLAQAMEAGAAGYLLKDTRRAELAQAIRQVHHGEVVISDSITTKSRIEYEERGGRRARGTSLPEQDASTILVEEVQMVMPPPIDANQLMRFISGVEELFQSRILQMVSSWQGDTAVTIPLIRSTPVASILSKLEKMPEIETIGEQPLTGKVDPRLFRKTESIPRIKTRVKKTFFVTLKNN